MADFVGVDGSQGLLIVNDDLYQTSWPTVELAAAKGISELDFDTGATIQLVDGSPRIGGVQLSFQPGGARLLLRTKP